MTANPPSEIRHPTPAGSSDPSTLVPQPSSFPADTRLIERWLPIAEIGEESVRERRSMTALPPTYYLHVWWARGPLVAFETMRLGLPTLANDLNPVATFLEYAKLKWPAQWGRLPLPEQVSRTGVVLRQTKGATRPDERLRDSVLTKPQPESQRAEGRRATGRLGTKIGNIVQPCKDWLICLNNVTAC